MASKIIDNSKIMGGVLTQAGFNANTWYERNVNGTFTVNSAWNGSENIFNWILTTTVDSKYTKSGVLKIASTKKSTTIRFDTSFPDTNYYVFFRSNDNSTLFWSTKYANRVVVNSSYSLGSEITWFAIHKTLLTSTGFNKSGNIFAGTRSITNNASNMYDTNGKLIETLDISNTSHYNGLGSSSWYLNEYIVQPNSTYDGIQTLPAFQPLTDSKGNIIKDGNGNIEYNYSVVISSNENINTYYIEKGTNCVKIGTSYPASCYIDYFIVKTGVDWWNLI
jgi:hypothetical protein